MSDITQRGAIVRDDNNVPVGYKYKNITTATTTLIKTGAGFLHSITINGSTASGVIEVDDALTHTTPIIGTLTMTTSPFPITLIYDVEFTTGLSITTSVEATDLTVSYI
jgi:hypothetical protein